MILMLHIMFGIATLLAGLSALGLRNKELIRYQITGFGGTVVSGLALAVVDPQVLTHVCLSGAMFTIVSLALYFRAQQSIAKT